MRAGVTFRREEKFEAYAQALRYAGVDPVPLQAPGPYSIDGIDGLLLTGGTDLDPELYGEERHPEADEPDMERDEMELWLLHDAITRDVPVFAICRGMQLFNVAFGGSLIQRLAKLDIHRQPGITDAHAITPTPGTALAAITGIEAYMVNSRHHQGVAKAAKGLTIGARSADGVIEALEHPGKRFAVAVQWHPEDRVPSHLPDTRLFEAFASALK